MSAIEEDFDRLALLDDEGWTAHNYYHDFLLKHVPQNCENAFEICCGTGAFARHLAERCKRVIALNRRLIHNGRLKRRQRSVRRGSNTVSTILT